MVRNSLHRVRTIPEGNAIVESRGWLIQPKSNPLSSTQYEKLDIRLSSKELMLSMQTFTAFVPKLANRPALPAILLALQVEQIVVDGHM